MFANALQCSGIFERVVCLVGTLEQRFVYFRLGVRRKVQLFPQQVQRILKRDRVGNVGTLQMCANDLFVERLAVMGDPHVVFAERVRASNGGLRRQKVGVLDHLCNAFGLFFRRETSHGRV